MAGDVLTQSAGLAPSPKFGVFSTSGSRSEKMKGVGATLRVLLVVVLSAVALAPVAIIVAGSFQLAPPGEPNVWGLEGWLSAFSSASIWESIFNTILLSLMRVPISVAIACVLAWLLIRTNLYGGRVIEFLFWIAFFLPTLPIAMAWVLLLDPHAGWINVLAENYLGIEKPFFNIYSYLGITWVHITATTVPIMVILLGPAIRSLDRSLEDSARMCGAGRVACLRYIVSPLILPSLMVATIACLIRSLEAFEIELYLGVPAGIRVYATKIHELAIWEPARYAPAMALSVPFVILLVVLAVTQQRFLRNRSFVTVTGKSAPITPIDLGRWRLPLSIVCMVTACVLVVVPMITLLFGSFMEVFGAVRADGSFALTLSHWEVVLNDPLFRSSVLNTVKIASITAVLSVFAFSMLAYFILRSEAPGRKFLGLVVWLPWAFPGILLSLSFLWIFLGTPGLNVLYGSLASLVLAMVFKEMPIAVNLMKGSLLQIGIELDEAGRISGANWWQRYWRILLPLLGPTAITVGMLAFIGSVKDISTMILLATPETRPLSLLVLDYSTSGSIENGAVAGVIAASLAVTAALFGRMLGMQGGAEVVLHRAREERMSELMPSLKSVRPSAMRIILLLLSLALPASVGSALAQSSGSDAAFKALVEAAKQEGALVVDGPPNNNLRLAISNGFYERYGIKVSYISSGGPRSGPRVRAERSSGRYLLDILVTGADSAVHTFLASGWLDPIQPILVDPNVTNLANWRDNQIKYVDPEQKILRLFSYSVQTIAINTKLVKAGEITSFQNLLDSKWRGKLMVRDPTVPGAGGSMISYLYLTRGPDFVTALYKTQRPMLVRDTRQAAQTLAQGGNAIWVGPDKHELARFKELDYPIDFIEPTDGPGIITGGFGLICLMNNAPNPNAAKLFVNWIASAEGQLLYGKAADSISLRTDIDQSHIDPDSVPDPQRKYFDTYDYEYVKERRDEAFKKARALLGL